MVSWPKHHYEFQAPAARPLCYILRLIVTIVSVEIIIGPRVFWDSFVGPELTDVGAERQVLPAPPIPRRPAANLAREASLETRLVF